MSADRHYSPADRFLLQADAALRTLLPFRMGEHEIYVELVVTSRTRRA